MTLFSTSILTAHPDPVNAVTFDGRYRGLIVATALVLIMTPGLGFFYGGMVGKKSSAQCYKASWL
jgi:Amt family ammonium transporter